MFRVGLKQTHEKYANYAGKNQNGTKRKFMFNGMKMYKTKVI